MAQENPSLESLLEEAKNAYRNEFGTEPDVGVCSPGRVNLIGEHTDYNDGFVLPMAVPLYTVIVGSKIAGYESTIITTSKDVGSHKKAVIEMPDKRALISYCKPGKPLWANYVRGVIVNYIGEAPTFQAVVSSSVPSGGGLSSSASLEVATYMFFDALTGPNNVLPKDKALACQRAEHKYAGTPCGIMDQFITMMGKENHALLLDCRTLHSKFVPLDDPNIVFLITNSNVKHSLADGQYAARKKQCQQAALLIKKMSLRDANEEDITYLQEINTDEEIIKRAQHVVTEILRTLEAAEALTERNYNKFGSLMTQSHESLRDDYEVSCKELDQLVELALEVDGVLGSRMTGGGFGGCTVTLAYSHAVQDVIEYINKKYKLGKPTFYICMPSDGAKILQACKEGHYY